MENNQNEVPKPVMTQEPSFVKTPEDRQMLQEIYINTRKAKNYMMWQLYITLALVVLPILAAVFLVPYALSSLSSAYSSAGLMLK